ncbi:hypothetical protein KP509_30G075100 [Ceratopteris richardii]|uniref:Pentatricopeptide repeat-containing protein n=1 Tax=Ceratopteris richardii TaxID=49495 RepID=A0A8T2R5P8_CERRI|nr:hypothetical protein KP509_30G075100 [Ceratopteris richardii]
MVVRQRSLTEHCLISRRWTRHTPQEQVRQPQEDLILYDDGSLEDGLPFFTFGPIRPPLSPPSSSSRSSTQKHHSSLRFDNCVSSLICFAKAKCLSEGMYLHCCIVDHCFDKSRLLGNLLVQLYGQCDAMDDAFSVFSNMKQKNLFTWNTLISACASYGYHVQALQLFHEMQKDGLTPNKFIFASIINACSSRPVALNEGRNIHNLIKKCGLECDVVVGTALLNMYGKCGSMCDVQDMFNKLQERDLVTWNAMIAVYAQQEQQQDAVYLYHQMLQEGSLPDEFTLGSLIDAYVTLAAFLPGKFIHACIIANGLDSDVVLSTALINLYGKCDSLEGALMTFEFMRERNRVTFINILSVCATHAAMDEGRCMHTFVTCYGLKLDINLGNAIINMYGKCSSLIDAHKVFRDMPERDIISWNAVMGVYAQNGQVKGALSLFDKMHRSGVPPNDITFINILSACSHAGFINQGLECFVSMGREHKVLPTVDHYNCVVDLLVRAGQLDTAEQLLENMCIEPSPVSWTTLLGACRSEGEIGRGDRIAKHVFKLDPNNPVHHVTLANIYAAVGRVDDASEIMNRLKGRK